MSNSFPQVNINLPGIVDNASKMKAKCLSMGIELTGVTKGAAGDLEVAKAFLKAGLTRLGDSRLKNLRSFQEAGLKAEYMLLRLPDPDRAAEVVELADISLNSEINTLQSLARAAQKRNKVHRVIIMVDVGDLREGVLPEDLPDFMAEAMDIKGIEIIGLGTNVGCYGGVLPTKENTEQLINLKRQLEEELSLNLELLSGGNTATTILLDEGKMPAGINHLRVGEGIIQGTDITHQRNIHGFSQNNISLSAAIIELKQKPSVPRGQLGHDAFGQKPTFVDKGVRWRAIVALGRQDVRIDGITPDLAGAEIIGASSDHLLLDVTETEVELKVGDSLDFALDYGAMLSAMTSGYLGKNYQKTDS